MLIQRYLSLHKQGALNLIKCTYQREYHLNFFQHYDYSNISSNSNYEKDKEILHLLSHENSKNLPAKDLIKLISLVKTSSLLNSPYINNIIDKAFSIKNDDLHKALEENLGTRLRTLSMLEEYKEKVEMKNFEAERKKLKQRASLLLKLTIISFILMTGFRIYYYLEYEVDPLHPRVSEYLLNRFK